MGTVRNCAGGRREAGYALLDALIALTIFTVSLSSVGLLMKSAIDRETELFKRTAAVITERNMIAEGSFKR